MQINQERFEAWLFAQPKDRVVNTGDAFDCVMCQFLRSEGHLAMVDFVDFAIQGLGRFPLPEWFLKVVNHEFCAEHTFDKVQDRYNELRGRHSRSRSRSRRATRRSRKLRRTTSQQSTHPQHEPRP